MTVRRAYHAPYAAAIFAALTLLLGVGAANSQNNLLFLSFGLAVGAFLVSGLVSGVMMMGLTARREPVEAGAVGEPMTLRYDVTNHNRFVPGFAIRVSEVGSAGFPTADSAPTWMRFMPGPRACVVHVGPRETVSIYTTITPSRRGIARLTGVRLTSSFPFGIFTKSVSIENAGEVPILPRVVRLRRDAMAALIGRSTFGQSSTPRRGSGEDFYGLREYQSGDSQRSIAWRPSARMGSLVVREHAAPRSGAIMIVLNLDDTPGVAAPQQQVEDAITLGASLLADSMARGMEAGIAAPGYDLLLVPGSGPRRRTAALTALAGIDVAQRSTRQINMEELERNISRAAPRAARVVIHAGAVDPAFGPAHARHLSSGDLSRLVADPDSSAASEGAAP